MAVITKPAGAVTTVVQVRESAYVVVGAPVWERHTPDATMFPVPHTTPPPPTGVRDGDAPAAGPVADGVGVPLGVAEAVGEGVAVGVPVGDAEALAPALSDAVGDAEMVLLGVAVAVLEGVPVGVPVGDGVLLYENRAGHSQPRTALLPASAMKRVPLRLAAGATPRAAALRRA